MNSCKVFSTLKKQIIKVNLISYKLKNKKSRNLKFREKKSKTEGKLIKLSILSSLSTKVILKIRSYSKKLIDCPENYKLNN